MEQNKRLELARLQSAFYFLCALCPGFSDTASAMQSLIEAGVNFRRLVIPAETGNPSVPTNAVIEGKNIILFILVFSLNLYPLIF